MLFFKLMIQIAAVITVELFHSNSYQTILNEPNPIKVGIPIRVGPADFSSAFSYYNTSPESPDGTKIAYTKFLAMPVDERSEKVAAEIWVCNANLSDHKKIVNINPLEVHNGARVQWLDNNSFVFQDDSIRVVDLNGNSIIAAISGRVGHETRNGKFLYSALNPKTQLSTIYEMDVSNQTSRQLGDVMDFDEIVRLFPSPELRKIKDMKILHLQYSPNGSKIAFRLDIGPRNEKYKHLVTCHIDGSDIQYFGPKPMHFAWYDDVSIMGHDNQISDGIPNNKECRRWNLDGTYFETLSGTGNHLAASKDRTLYASESWYQQIPVVLKVFRKGELDAFWQDTVSVSKHTTWTLANHVNPAFSRDGKRVYYNKCIGPRVVQTYMIVLP